VPDTVGYTTPGEFFNLIQGLRKNVKGIEDVTISVHGHDDLGMAVANFLAAIEGGSIDDDLFTTCIMGGPCGVEQVGSGE